MPNHQLSLKRFETKYGLSNNPIQNAGCLTTSQLKRQVLCSHIVQTPV